MHLFFIRSVTIVAVLSTICASSRLQHVLKETWAGMSQYLWTGQSAIQSSSIEIVGVGISLSPSYITVVVALKNNSYVTFQSDKDPQYQSLMEKLSLSSSTHLSPPYESVGDELADQPRQLQRQARKTLGLPASRDVGILSTTISQLLHHASLATGRPITSATISTPHLIALYEEDILDTCSYLNITHLKPRHYVQRLLLETASLYAGYGLGLCRDPANIDECTREEVRMKEDVVFHIDVSEKALVMAFSVVGPATYVYEPGYRHVEDFSLGFEALEQHGEDQYWTLVASAMQDFLATFVNMKAPARIMMTGDIDGGLLPWLEGIGKKAVGDLWHEEVQILAEDPKFIVAKGAAEFARRAGFS